MEKHFAGRQVQHIHKQTKKFVAGLTYRHKQFQINNSSSQEEVYGILTKKKKPPGIFLVPSSELCGTALCAL